MSNQQHSRYKAALGGLLGVALAFTLALHSARAQDTALLSGGFTPISVNVANPDGVNLAIIAPSAPTAGALVYTDFKQLEARARGLLDRNRKFRESISPYGQKPDFDALVRQFNYQSGFSRPITATGSVYIGQTIEKAIEKANDELLEARDLYAYLAVYADKTRFRGDADYISNILAPATSPLCGATDQENPNPPAQTNPPTAAVLPPVIDWCNFTARLRQSVREAANIRMIFAQQFVADALGLHFSADFVGGEQAVRDEVAKLRLAHYEYAEAEKELAGALEHSLGNGCLVADFYTQAEWSLLSRAAEGQETTQHHIGVRQSYLGIENPTDVSQAQAAAQSTFRSAAVDGYIKLIGMAGLVGATQPATPGCSQGERPDGLLVAEMAVNLLQTRQAAHEVTDGRNIFGFDVMFTPARPYRTAPNSPDHGLWDEAKEAAKTAKNLQENDIDRSRAFDTAQSDLLQAVNKIHAIIDKEVAAQSGCSRTDHPEDAPWLACIDRQTALLQQCLDYVQEPDAPPKQPITGIATFDACINRAEILPSEAKQMLLDLRIVRVQMRATTKRAENINARIQNSNDRNVTVRKWLLTSGIAETAARASQATLDTFACLADNEATILANVKNIGCGISGVVNGVLQATAGALSAAADVEIEDADNHKEVQNLLLNLSELLIDQYAAVQQFNSKQVGFDRLLGALADNKIESQRQRAYLALSPGNDPSFRIVRDSTRLVLAKQLEYAARISYLAARRAEYEYGARLSASKFRISDIYRARSADDILGFLARLEGVTNNLAGGVSDAQINPVDLKLSVALHVLGLTDAALATEGFASPAAAQAERTRRFRLWVAQNTQTGSDGKAQLKFSFTTSVLDKGIFSNVTQQGYERYWLHKLAGVGLPKPANTGVSVNVRSDQAGDLSYRTVALTQGGLAHLRAASGCVFDYRLLAPAVLLGLEWAKNQPPEAATATFQANVNQAHAIAEPGFATSGFLGRPVSATDWQVLLYAGAPAAGLADMDLQQLTDLELNFSTTYASRQPATPQPSECTRIDY